MVRSEQLHSAKPAGPELFRDAPDPDHAQRAIEGFARDYGVKVPEAMARVIDDARNSSGSSTSRPSSGSPDDQQLDQVGLLRSHARDAGHKRSGSKAAGLTMAFKLLKAAQDRWRAVNGPVPGRADARFDKGVTIEGPEEV